LVNLQGQAKEFFLAHDVSHRLVLQSALCKTHQGVYVRLQHFIMVMRQQPSAVVQGSAQGVQEQNLRFQSGQAKHLSLG
jgi:hypothetical protein